ncbi:MAG: hypothetical protein SFV21_20660, partial [Rhodospirillaceae bacterium]|nr:hypothetical protein [Rhodospirillaceae bacterium]
MAAHRSSCSGNRSFVAAIAAALALSVAPMSVWAQDLQAAGTRPTQFEALSLRSQLQGLTADGGSITRPSPDAAPSASERAQAASPGVVRVRPAAVDAAAISKVLAAPDLMVDADGDLVGTPPAFPLDLFADTGLRLIKLDARADDQGVTILRGLVLPPVAGSATAAASIGTATFAIDGDQLTGAIRLGRRTYTILPDGTGGHRIAEIDLPTLPRVADDAIRPPAEEATPAPAESPRMLEKKSAAEPAAPRTLERAHDGETIITLFVVYT